MEMVVEGYELRGWDIGDEYPKSRGWGYKGDISNKYIVINGVDILNKYICKLSRIEILGKFGCFMQGKKTTEHLLRDLGNWKTD